MTSANISSAADITGMYTHSDVDSQTQIILLDDNTFCLTFMGGSLDMFKAGHWKIVDKDIVQLQEVRNEEPIHPAWAKNVDRLGPTLVGVNFDGYTLSNAYSPVFAYSSNDTIPTTFRPIFPDHVDSWAMTYALPLMPADTIRYFYIGDIEMSDRGPTQRLRVTQYKLEGYDAVRIGYNRLQDGKAMTVKARVNGETVEMAGITLGRKVALTPTLVAEVRQICINPVLHKDKHREMEQNEPGEFNQHHVLTPVKTFILDAGVISGEPIFANKSTANTTATDLIDELIESERGRLQSTFDAAMADANRIDEFLQLTKDLTTKKKRLGMHMAMLTELQTKLMVKVNEKRDLKSAEKIFYHYREHIYPISVNYKHEEVLYRISVFASQGLILAMATNNPDISKIVFNDLLGPKFNITKHSNRVLIYNLSCYYAVNNNTKDMLIAIKEARKRGTPKEQFIKDSDFKNYLNNPEFLSAIE